MNSFYKRRFNFHLLADVIVPRNTTAAAKLQTSVSNEDIYCLTSMKDNAWNTVILYCHFFSFLLLLSCETKYHSSHLFQVNYIKIPVKSHKGLKDAGSFAKSCYIKNCSEKFHKFHRKESLMKSFLS